MKKGILSLIILLVAYCAQAQKDTTYFNNKLQQTFPKNATIYRVWNNNSFTDYQLPNNKVIATGAYKNKKRNGSFILFYPNNTIKLKAAYENGEVTKPIEYYYDNGQLAYSLINDKQPLEFVAVYDKNGNELLRSGNTNFSAPIDNDIVEGYIFKGKMSGKWTLTIEDTTYIERFLSGEQKQMSKIIYGKKKKLYSYNIIPYYLLQLYYFNTTEFPIPDFSFGKHISEINFQEKGYYTRPDSMPKFLKQLKGMQLYIKGGANSYNPKEDTYTISDVIFDENGEKSTVKMESDIGNELDKLILNGSLKGIDSFINFSLPYAPKNNTYVYIDMLISENGEVAEAKIMRGIGEKMDAQILKNIQNMPLWQPGKHNGKNVPVGFILKTLIWRPELGNVYIITK